MSNDEEMVALAAKVIEKEFYFVYEYNKKKFSLQLPQCFRPAAKVHYIQFELKKIELIASPIKN